jgi:hypothetical protein
MRLVRALDSDDPHDELHLSALAEAQFARHMLHAGCTLEFETATPSGKHADFRVQRDETRFFVHIKRLWVDSGEPAAPMPKELLSLGRIARPMTLDMNWDSTANSTTMAQLAREAGDFALQASVGDELVVRDPDGIWIGRARVAAPHAGTHVQLSTGSIDLREAAVPRAQRLLRRAFGQFMPGAPNVICIAGDGSDSAAALEIALLGSVVERWDVFPPKGQRMAHGRAEDGFWAQGLYEGSELVVWLPVQGDEPTRLWRREGTSSNHDVEAILRQGLSATPQV